jgi:hypothetical protein
MFRAFLHTSRASRAEVDLFLMSFVFSSYHHHPFLGNISCMITKLSKEFIDRGKYLRCLGSIIKSYCTDDDQVR